MKNKKIAINTFGSITELRNYDFNYTFKTPITLMYDLHSLQGQFSDVHILTDFLKLSMELALFNFSGILSQIFGPKTDMFSLR